MMELSIEEMNAELARESARIEEAERKVLDDRLNLAAMRETHRLISQTFKVCATHQALLRQFGEGAIE